MKDAPSPLGSDGPVRPAGSASRTGLGVSGRARILAVAALLALCALVAAVIVFLLRSAGYVFLGLAGAAISIGGAWWFLTGRKHRRAFGAAGVLFGRLQESALEFGIARAQHRQLRPLLYQSRNTGEQQVQPLLLRQAADHDEQRPVAARARFKA